MDTFRAEFASASQTMVSIRRISVAGIAVEFRGDANAAEIIDRRYCRFYLEPQGLNAGQSVDAVVGLDLYPCPPDPWAGEFKDVDCRGGHITLRGPGVEARIKEDATHATLHAPCTERSIDGVLRYLLSQQVLMRGGLMVHASAVLKKERAWVFAGASGSGKSTLAQLLGGRCLGDEAIILLPEGEIILAHATPYWRASPGYAEIAALVFHKQGDTNELCALSQSRATAKLISCTGPLLPPSLDEAMGRADAIVAALAPRVLHLSLDSKDAIETWLPKQMADY